MTTERIAVLIQTKLKLPEKYARLGAKAKSQPNRVKFRHNAKRYRHQAVELSRK